jgi:hypothetical protein
MGLTSDLRRRRAGLHQHREQSSPPKPQPRVAAGPAIRVAESQIGSDSIGVVDSAVEFLEPNPPLSTMLCYRSGFIGDAAERFAGPSVTLRRSRTQDTARVEQLRGHTAKKPTQPPRHGREYIRDFRRQCVGGDGHPVGVRRHLNDQRIYGMQFVVLLRRSRTHGFSGGGCLRSVAEPTGHRRRGFCTSEDFDFFGCREDGGFFREMNWGSEVLLLRGSCLIC